MNWTGNLWNLLKKYWWLFLVIVLLLATLDSLIRGLDWSNWAEPGPRAITLWGRSLWDWAGLLLVPLVLAIGGFLFQRNERNTDREIAEKRHETDQQIAKEARMDKTLDDYLDAMTGFLLQENSLLESEMDDPIRDVARTQTITVIKRLDSERNQIVFQFLQEAKLISTYNWEEDEEEIPIISLDGADLRSANLHKVNMTGVDLIEASLKDADLTMAVMVKAKLHKANLDRADLEGADLRWADLSGADLVGANLREADLGEADLQWAVLEGAKLPEADLQDADLQDANLPGADLPKANLQGANLQRAGLQDSNLQRAYLSNAKLQGAYMKKANLQEADLREANLQETNLQETNLQEAIFSDITLIRKKGYFKGTTMPDGTIFSESTDLKKFTDPAGQ